MPSHINAQALAAASIAKNSKSFALASRLLPRRVRDDAVVLYAWCRYADDAVDEAESPLAARTALTRLDQELAAIYDGQMQGQPLLAALQEMLQRRQIPQLYPQELLAGMRMDVDGVRYGDSATLMLYCWRVAGVVGLMMCHVMGVTSDRALQQASDLGIAMQLTNICRDVAEDWQRGRLYLPADVLARHGLQHWPAMLGGPLAEKREGEVAPVVAELLGVADRYYQSGARGLTALPWRCALAIAVASAVYRDIGRVLTAQGHDPFAGRAHTTLARKLWLVARTTLAQLGQLPARMRTLADAQVPQTLLTGPAEMRRARET